MSLPPMNALPVFEAVGRHLSVANAADELNITPGAVSKQLRNLEAFLGCDLFVRGHRSISFTNECSVYWANIRSAVTDIGVATEEIAKGREQRKIVIGCTRVFLEKCIMPKLRGFYAQHPDIDVKFVVGASHPEINPELDGQIGIGDHSRKAFVSENLVACDLAVVCSPDYLTGKSSPKSVSDLSEHILLRSPEFTKNWETWLGDNTTYIFEQARFIDFENAGLEISAAMEGLGIAIVRLNLVESELKAGDLCVLLEEHIVHDHYSFFFAEAKLQSANFKVFRRWLRGTLSA